MHTDAAPQRKFVLAAAGVLFAGSGALTVAWCEAMSAMHAMPMPGGWTLSMMWMPMPGQTWPGTAADFLAMWLVMTLAMMLPSLLPMLWCYRRAVAHTSPARLEGLTALVAAAYFAVWMLCGIVAFVIGAALAALALEAPGLARAAPLATAALVCGVGALQFSRWKSRHLACCRAAPACCLKFDVNARTAWRHGIALGVHCVHCCSGLTAILLAAGMMNLSAMAWITAAISVERLAPGGARAARLIGAILIAAGAWLAARAMLA